MCMSNLYVVEFDNGDNAFNARNKLLEFDEVDFFRAYQRTF